MELQVDEGKPRRWIYLLTIGTSIVVIALVVIYLVLRRTPHLTEKDSVVIAEFSNSTGDPIFDEALRQGLAVQLEQSPFLQIVSDERVHHVLQLMGKAPNERFGAAAAREVCERIGATALLEGSIASLGHNMCLD